MALSYNLAYQEIISVHPTRRQIFAGKTDLTFWNIWQWVISRWAQFANRNVWSLRREKFCDLVVQPAFWVSGDKIQIWWVISDYWLLILSRGGLLPGRSPSPWLPPQVVGRRRRCRLCRAAGKIGKDNFESLFVVLVLWVSINFPSREEKMMPFM